MFKKIQQYMKSSTRKGPMTMPYDVKKNPDKLLTKPSQIDVDPMRQLLFA